MEKFTLEEYLKDPSRKVVTRDGKSARIICTDVRGNYPIATLISEGGREMVATYSTNGEYVVGDSHSFDLFFVPKEPTYRPYGNAKEFLEAQKEHGMYLYFQSERSFKAATGVYESAVAILWDSKIVEELKYVNLYVRAVWQDGSPCGIKEE